MLPVQECSFRNANASREIALRETGSRPNRGDINTGNLNIVDPCADILTLGIGPWHPARIDRPSDRVGLSGRRCGGLGWLGLGAASGQD